VNTIDEDRLVARIRRAYEAVSVPPISAEIPSTETGSPWRRWQRSAAIVVLAGLLVVGAAAWQTAVSQPTLGWEPVPRPQDQWIVSQAERSCGPGADLEKRDNGQPLNAGLPVAIVDARGQTAVAFFTDGTRFATCQFAWSADGTPLWAVAGQGGALGEGGSLDVITALTDAEGRYSMIVGHVPAVTAQVKVDLETEPLTTASIGEGYYLAWWPSFDFIKSLTASDADGHVLGTFEPLD
jgi:hypothetical protein